MLVSTQVGIIALVMVIALYGIIYILRNMAIDKFGKTKVIWFMNIIGFIIIIKLFT